MKKIIKTLILLGVIVYSLLSTAYATTYYCTGEGVRIRSTAENREDNIIGRLPYGAVLNVLNNSGSWYYIQYGNICGYVTRTYISTYESNVSTKTIALTKKSVSLKQSTSSSSHTVCSVPKKAVVKVISKHSSWSYVQYNGSFGYIKSSNLNTIVNQNEYCIGSYTVSYSLSNKARSNNIAKAAGKLNGYVVKPGQTFSFLKVIGTSGYASAPEFNKKEKIVGGGIAQVSTSLYQCVRDAQRNGCFINVKNQPRYTSKTPYAKLGEEAMVSIANKNDFTFVNSAKYSIKIYSNVSGNNVSFVISKI